MVDGATDHWNQSPATHEYRGHTRLWQRFHGAGARLWLLARAAHAAADVLGSEGELMVMEGTPVSWVPLDDQPGESSRRDMVVGGSNSCSPSLEEPSGPGVANGVSGCGRVVCGGGHGDLAGVLWTLTPPRKKHRHNRQLQWHTVSLGKASDWQLCGSHGP